MYMCRGARIEPETNLCIWLIQHLVKYVATSMSTQNLIFSPVSSVDLGTSAILSPFCDTYDTYMPMLYQLDEPYIHSYSTFGQLSSRCPHSVSCCL